MADPSPSPSGISHRLSELLDQQQEPFSLDLYLVEKGCSPALLDAAVGGCGGACSTCWPWPRTRSAGRTPERPAASKKVSYASGVLRLLLCKILRGKMTPPPTTKKNQKQLRLAAINRLRIDVDGEKQRTPDDSKNSVPPPHRVEASVVKAEEEEVEDDYSNKRLSTVSVLEQRPLEHSQPPHEQKALLIFRKLMQAAYSTALLDIFADTKDGSRSNNSKTKNSSTSTAAVARNNHREEDVFEEALAEVTDIIATEMAGARAAWPRDVQQEWRDVGADIAAAVLEALVEEMAPELMGSDGRDFAVDTAHRTWLVSRG